jgi:ketol-acid reductoisomerase
MKKILGRSRAASSPASGSPSTRAASRNTTAPQRGEKHLIEKTGQRLRGMMPWMSKKNIKGVQAAY